MIIPMKQLLALSVIALASCASTLNSHRMKAAQRKMLDTRTLQQAGQWDEALAMAERMHSSVSKSITTAPMQKAVGGSEIDLRPLLAGWTNGPFAELKTALQKKDARHSTHAFASLRQQCVNCHTVLGKTQAQVSVIP
jgi:mono/diheme cytochrome c family protein